MNRLTVFIAAIILGLSSYQWVNAEDHSGAALKHAQLGAQHGRMGHADVLTNHVEEALVHAQASHEEHLSKANHINEAITHLKEAIKHGKAGHADMATDHTQMAIEHIKPGK